MTGPHCGNCIRWEDHKAWGDIGFCNEKKSDTPKAGGCPKWIQNTPKANKKNMGYIDSRPESDITGPSGPFPYSIEDDGTLVITVPKGTKVGRVLVQEEGTQYGGLFYAD